MVRSEVMRIKAVDTDGLVLVPANASVAACRQVRGGVGVEVLTQAREEATLTRL